MSNLRNSLKHTTWTLLALVGLAACAPAGDSVDTGEPVLVAYTLTPDADIFGFTQRAVYRWNTARGCEPGSGCELTIGEGGIPVGYVDEILMPGVDEHGDPMHASGASQPMPPGLPGCDWQHVHVSLTGNDPQRTLLHELGHVLGITQHTLTGVTMDRSRLSDAEAKEMHAWSITEEVLTEVCSKTACAGFQPEVP